MMRGELSWRYTVPYYWSGQSDVGGVNCLLFSRVARLRAAPLPNRILYPCQTEKQKAKERDAQRRKCTCQFKAAVCNSTTKNEMNVGQNNCFKKKSKMLHNIHSQNFSFRDTHHRHMAQGIK